MIRMLLGILFLIKATAALEQAVTAITANDIVNDVESFVVTASAEQIPRICKAIGLLLKIGSSTRSLADDLLDIVSSGKRSFSFAAVLILHLFYVWAKSFVAHPKIDHVGHAIGSDGRP